MQRKTRESNKITAADARPETALNVGAPLAESTPPRPAVDAFAVDGLAADGLIADGVVTKSTRRAAAEASVPAMRSRRRAPLSIADNYLFWQLVSASLRGLLWFGGILMIVTVLTALRKMSANGLPMLALLEFIWYQIPRIIQYSLPMSVLFGTVQTFSELSGRGEITALWAGGMSFKRMLRAPLLWGCILAVLAFFLQEFLVPGAETKMGELRSRKVDQLGIQQDFSYRHPPRGPLKRVIQAAVFDPATNTLVRPSVQLYKERDVYLQISAERGSWDESTGLWTFYNGIITFFPSGRSRASGNEIEQKFQSIEKSADELVSPNALQAQQNSRAEHLANGNFEMVSMFELSSYRNALREAQESPDLVTRKLINGATYGIHEKIATPFLCLALILVGAPLGLRPQRSSAGFAPGLSLLVIMLYYFTWMALAYPGKHGTANPYLMAYLAPVMTALVGLVLVWKKNR